MKKIIQIVNSNIQYVGPIALTEDGKLYQLKCKSVNPDDFYWQSLPTPDIHDEEYEELGA